MSRRPYTRWPPERDAEFRRLYLAGTSRAAIAAIMGITATAVRARAGAVGLRRRFQVGSSVRVGFHAYTVHALLPSGEPLVQRNGRTYIVTAGAGLRRLDVPRAAAGTRYRLRCIGAGAAHWFMSRDPKAERMCGACKARSDVEEYEG